MTNETTKRDKDNGQYTHTLERVCARCGLRKGLHSSVKPYPIEDGMVGDCEGFKAAKR